MCVVCYSYCYSLVMSLCVGVRFAGHDKYTLELLFQNMFASMELCAFRFFGEHFIRGTLQSSREASGRQHQQHQASVVLLIFVCMRLLKVALLQKHWTDTGSILQVAFLGRQETTCWRFCCETCPYFVPDCEAVLNTVQNA